MKYILAISLALPSLLSWTVKWNGGPGAVPDVALGATWAIKFRFYK